MDLGPEALRSISHDMRNLLTAVRGHAELALRGLSADDPAREDVAHCVVVTAALFELVDQLDGADASHTLAGVNLDASVHAMRRLLDALLPPSVELHMQTDADGACVTISKLRIERIVLNLVLNARDAMEDGGRVSIETARDSGVPAPPSPSAIRGRVSPRRPWSISSRMASRRSVIAAAAAMGSRRSISSCARPEAASRWIPGAGKGPASW